MKENVLNIPADVASIHPALEGIYGAIAHWIGLETLVPSDATIRALGCSFVQF